MKLNIFTRSVENGIDVFATADDRLGTSMECASTTLLVRLSAAVIHVANRCMEGKVNTVSGAEFETLKFLGVYDTDTGHVDISHCPMFLLRRDRKHFFWLANEKRFATLESLEQFIDSMGLGRLDWEAVDDTQVFTVIRNFTSVEKLLPQVVVVLDDGNLKFVQLGGCSPHLKVRVFNIVHGDDLGDKEEGQIGSLLLDNGVRFENVEELTAETDVFESALQVARYI
jgi:hypothetical protein